MKIKEGFKLRELGGEYIVVGEGLEQIDFNKIINLNGSAAYLWEELANSQDFTVEDAAQLLTAKYDIDLETATNDAKNLLDVLKKEGVLE